MGHLNGFFVPRGVQKFKCPGGCLGGDVELSNWSAHNRLVKEFKIQQTSLMLSSQHNKLFCAVTKVNQKWSFIHICHNYLWCKLHFIGLAFIMWTLNTVGLCSPSSIVWTRNWINFQTYSFADFAPAWNLCSTLWIAVCWCHFILFCIR